MQYRGKADFTSVWCQACLICLSRVPVPFHYFASSASLLIVHVKESVEDKLSSLGLINSLLLSYFRTVRKLIMLSYRSRFFHLRFQEKMFTPEAWGKKPPLQPPFGICLKRHWHCEWMKGITAWGAHQVDLYCITWSCLSIISCMTERVLGNVRNGIVFVSGKRGSLDIFASNTDSEITVAPHLSADLCS